MREERDNERAKETGVQSGVRGRTRNVTQCQSVSSRTL